MVEFESSILVSWTKMFYHHAIGAQLALSACFGMYAILFLHALLMVGFETSILVFLAKMFYHHATEAQLQFTACFSTYSIPFHHLPFWRNGGFQTLNLRIMSQVLYHWATEPALTTYFRAYTMLLSPFTILVRNGRIQILNLRFRS